MSMTLVYDYLHLGFCHLGLAESKFNNQTDNHKQKIHIEVIFFFLSFFFFFFFVRRYNKIKNMKAYIKNIQKKNRAKIIHQ